MSLPPTSDTPVANDAESSQPVGWKPFVKVCIMAAVLAGAVVLIRQTHLAEHFQSVEWRAHLQEQWGRWLPVIYVAAGAILIAMPFPRIVYSALGGALFGFIGGSLWAHAATMLGSILCFWFAKSLGREWVEHKFGRRFHRIERRLHDEGFAIMLLVRLCPVGNNFVTNCLAGVSAMRAWPFFWASLIGHFPLTAFFALLGSGMVKGQNHQTTISLVGMVVFALAFVLYFRYSRNARSVARDLRGHDDTK
ncbi:MAG: TVP38/TMEM64 family protein [Candidatus Sumerlaeota bacterium]|nr:TVP38/TMEM64 family protein [Candidatus Sumerlaeota bacterium]